MSGKWPTPAGIQKQTLGHYELISSLGEGSLGKVFYAEDTSHDPPRPVAIKVLHSHLLADSEAVAELQHEAEILGRLSHPNIIRLVEIKVEPDQAYLVTEYAGGGSLAQKIKSCAAGEYLPLDEIQSYLKQITEALNQVHNSNLIHCDLKPENILLDEDGNIKLADFSLAARVNWYAAFLRESEQAWGTPYYAAPELWEGQIGKVTDIYALGVILYQLITGVTPYQGSREELKEQHRNAPIPSLKENAPDLDYPLGLEEVIAGAMAKDPKGRFSSARQLYSRFAMALEEGSSAAASAILAPQTAPASTPASSGSNPASSLNQKLAKVGTATTSSPAASNNSSSSIILPMSWYASGSSGSTSNLSTSPATRSISSNWWYLAGVIGAIILIAGYNFLFTGTTTRNKPGVDPGSVTTSADNSALIIRWHKSPVMKVFWNDYANRQYPGLNISPYVYSIASDGKAVGWDNKGKGLYAVIKDQFGIFTYYTAAAVSSKGTNAIATREYEIFLLENGKDAGGNGVFAKGHTAYINTLAWSPDGQTLASGADDVTVRLWSLSGKEISVLKDSTGRIKSLAWSPDGKLLAAGADNGTIYIWKASGELVTTITRHTGSVNSVAWQPVFNSYLLASASDDLTVRLWDQNGKPVANLSGHKSPVNSVTWSPDGTKFATGSDDTSIRVWNVNGDLLKVLQGHTAAVNSVAWSPDGTQIASGSTDTTVRLWKQ